ncbi:MAG: hypothetical protein ABIN48_15215 [Ginsengibacter sp.]
MTILTSEPSSLTIDKDTIGQVAASRSLEVKRNKEPLTITVFNDSLSKTVNIKSKNSFAYWLNVYPNWHFWTGFYIDTKTKKRYTYPRTVYVDLGGSDSTYLTYNPVSDPLNKQTHIFKLTPLKIVGFSNPSVELSYELKTSRSFSTQIMASYMLPFSVIEIANDFKPEMKGYRVSLEERFYLKKSAPLGTYLSFEINYLNNQYKDIWYFGVKEIYTDTTYNFTNYPDTFGVKKQTYSLNFKYGYQKIFNRFSIDIYAGLGLRYKDVKHFDRIKPEDEMELPRHPNMYYMTNREGKYWTISIPLNIKIGWAF